MGPAGARHALARRVEASALEAFRRLPLTVRRLVTRAVAPAYRVGAVAVCLDAEHRVLLVRSRHQRGWGLPGGLLQRDEQPAATLVREMAEEIGVVVAARELSTPAATIVDSDARQVTIVYLVTLPTDAVPDGVEVVQVDWFSRTAIPVDVVRGTAESLRLTGFTAS